MLVVSDNASQKFTELFQRQEVAGKYAVIYFAGAG